MSANSGTDDTAHAPGSASIAYVTITDEATAKQLARDLIDANLAACVNIVPSITSIYRWEGKVQEDAESMLLIKTMTSRVPELCAFVRAHHPYEVAEVIAMPIAQGNPPYMQFLQNAMK